MLVHQLDNKYGSNRKFITISFNICCALFFYDKAANEKTKKREKFY